MGAAFQRVDKLDVVLKYLVKTKGQDDAAVRTDTFLMHKKLGVFSKFCDAEALLGNLLIATRFTKMLNYLEITSSSTVDYSKDKRII